MHTSSCLAPSSPLQAMVLVAVRDALDQYGVGQVQYKIGAG